ncbi:MAG: hypothetical protein HY866_06700 [Chloroflexi bacterium]|nr:hypothetical protein [Chloroflexota bacterium]
MSRPIVKIKAPNRLHALRTHLDQRLPQFAALPGVIGITLNGGLSRGYADHLSEIDVTFYLTLPVYQQWQAGKAPLGTGIQMIDGVLYDLKSFNLEDERAREWEMVTLWDASYAEILHDPTGGLAALFAEKLAKRPSPQDAGGPLFAAWWYFELAGAIWIHRSDPLQGHMMLTQAIIELVKALFLMNSEYIPHEKWLIHMSCTLEWTPPDWEARLTSALCDLTPTVDGLRQRQQRIASLWHDIDRRIISICLTDYPAGLHFSHQHFYHLLVWLVENSPVSVSDWQSRVGLDMLNNAPFNGCVRLEGECIILDRDRLAGMNENDVYRWHYAIIEAVRGRA